MVSGASVVRISTRRTSAVSCELFQTSFAWFSGESSSPTAAWMPPCAFAELHDCRAAFVATATRAPARSAATAEARPEAPLPITSTSKERGRATVADDTTVALIRPISSAYLRRDRHRLRCGLRSRLVLDLGQPLEPL